MQRVPSDLLDFDNYVYSLQGNPFTGIAFEKRDDDTMWSEQTFNLGLPDGPSRSWYPSGKLESETNYKLGLAHGSDREWYPDGRPRSEAFYELGIRLESKKWAPDGKLTEYFRLDPLSSDFRELQKRRVAEAGRVSDIIAKLGGESAIV